MKPRSCCPSRFNAHPESAQPELGQDCLVSVDIFPVTAPAGMTMMMKLDDWEEG